MPNTHDRGFVRKTVRAALASALVAAASLGSGCANGAEGAFSGAALGALGGMALGSLGGHMGEGAAAGAVIGGLTGAVIGDQNARNAAYAYDAPLHTSYGGYRSPAYWESSYSYQVYTPRRWYGSRRGGYYGGRGGYRYCD